MLTMNLHLWLKVYVGPPGIFSVGNPSVGKTANSSAVNRQCGEAIQAGSKSVSRPSSQRASMAVGQPASRPVGLSVSCGHSKVRLSGACDVCVYTSLSDCVFLPRSPPRSTVPPPERLSVSTSPTLPRVGRSPLVPLTGSLICGFIQMFQPSGAKRKRPLPRFRLVNNRKTQTVCSTNGHFENANQRHQSLCLYL